MLGDLLTLAIDQRAQGHGSSTSMPRGGAVQSTCTCKMMGRKREKKISERMIMPQGAQEDQIGRWVWYNGGAQKRS